VIITNLDVISIAVFKPKTDPPLIIDRNRMLTLPVALQRVEPISWRRSQVLERACQIYIFELSGCSLRYTCREAVSCVTGMLVG
jgi:hypothetical protein